MKLSAGRSLFTVFLMPVASALMAAAPASAQVSPGRRINAEKPAPCVCKKNREVDCPGETNCDDGQWSACRCDEKGQCVGRCFDEESTKDGLKLAASVLSIITDELLTAEDIKRDREKFAPILAALLSSKDDSDLYTVEYKDHFTSFSFIKSTVGLLHSARAQLSRKYP